LPAPLVPQSAARKVGLVIMPFTVAEKRSQILNGVWIVSP
jgi:hypothetical protein